MNNVKELLEYFGNDHFAIGLGCEIASVEEDRTLCTLQVRKSHLNALGVVQGGMIFTLADYAFAVASNSLQYGAVTLNSTINFVNPGKGAQLKALAVLKKRTKRTCLYEMTVTDENDELVALVTATGYYTNYKGSK